MSEAGEAPPTADQAALVPPDRRYGPSFVEALREGFRRGNRPRLRPREVAAVERDLDAYLALRLRQTGDIVLPGGRRVPAVPCSLHWLVAGETFIGEMSFRHVLNDYLRLSGGHIGYGIRPHFEGRGFGKRLLALGKAEARKKGLTRLLLTCHEANPASAGIIEANGGRLEDVVQDIFGGGPLRRYWIDL